MSATGIILIAVGSALFIANRLGWSYRRTRILIAAPVLIVVGILILTGVIEPRG